MIWRLEVTSVLGKRLRLSLKAYSNLNLAGVLVGCACAAATWDFAASRYGLCFRELPAGILGHLHAYAHFTLWSCGLLLLNMYLPRYNKQLGIELI